MGVFAPGGSSLQEPLLHQDVEVILIHQRLHKQHPRVESCEESKGKCHWSDLYCTAAPLCRGCIPTNGQRMMCSVLLITDCVSLRGSQGLSWVI